MLNASALHPRVPLELQVHILRSLRRDLDSDHRFPFRKKHFVEEEEACRTLFSCSLVCREWLQPSQNTLLSWIILRKSPQLDQLFRLLRSGQESLRPAHLLLHIRRISVVYHEPYFKLGEALPRIASINPPNLVRVDIASNGISTFPFHPSLPLQLSRLSQVRTLYLVTLRFIHLSELRQLINAFSGLHTVILDNFVHVGEDRRSNFRILRGASRYLRSVGCWFMQGGPSLPLSCWLPDPRSSRSISSQNSVAPVDAIPVLSPILAKFLDKLQPPIPVRYGYYELWQWRHHESAPGSQLWSLSSVCCDGEVPITTRSFTFHADVRISTRIPNPVLVLEMRHLVEIELEARYGLDPKDRGWDHIQGVLHGVDSRLPELDRFEALKLNFLSKPDNIPKRYRHFTGEQWRKECFLRVESVMKTSQEDHQYSLDVKIDGHYLEKFPGNNDGTGGFLLPANAKMVT